MRSKAGREGTAPVNENGMSVTLAVAVVVVVAIVSGCRTCAELLDDDDGDDGERVVLRPRLILGLGAFCTMVAPSIFLDALVNRSSPSSSSSSSLEPLRLFSLGRMRPAVETIRPGVGVDGRDRARASASRRLSSSSSSSLGRLGGGPPEGKEVVTCL